MTTEAPKAVTYGVLVAAMAWMAWALPDSVAGAWEQAHHHASAAWFLGFGLAALILGCAGLLVERVRRIGMATALVGLLAVGVYVAMNTPIEGDEWVHLHPAWLIAHGLMPYRDFFLQYQYLWALGWSPVVALQGDNLHLIEALRLCQVLVMGLTVGVATAVARRMQASPWSAAVLLLCLPEFVTGLVQYRPDPLANVAVLLGLWCLLMERDVLAGACLGLGMALSQKAFVGTAALVLYLLVQREWRRLPRVLAPALGVLALMLVWPVFGGFGKAYVTSVYLVGSQLVHALMGWTAKTWYDYNYATVALRLNFMECPMLLVLLLLGLRRSTVGWSVAVVSLMVLAIGLNAGFKQYTLFLWCLIPLLGARGLAWMEGGDGLAPGAACFAVCCVAAVALLRFAAQGPLPGLDVSAEQAALDVVPPNGYYYNELGNLGNPVFRLDSGYYWYAQELYEPIYQAHPSELPGNEPLSPPFASRPPAAWRAGAERERALLSQLQALGLHYHHQGGLWVRDLLKNEQ